MTRLAGGWIHTQYLYSRCTNIYRRRGLSFLSRIRDVIAPRTSPAAQVTSPQDAFNVTTWRYLFNEQQQRDAQRREFNIDALKQIACSAVGANFCHTFQKESEDSNRRQFRLKFDNGAEAIAQIPLSGAGPAKLVTASEVATMDYVRNILNVPVPRVLAYSSDASSTPVGAEFVIKDTTPGTSFDDRIRTEKGPWPTADMIHLCDQVIEHEAAFLRARFAYHGSLFYKEDVSPDLQANPLYHKESEITAGADRFRIGPSMMPHFWVGGKASMDIDRGPWSRAEDCAVATVLCERAWISQNADGPQVPRLFGAHPPSTYVSTLDAALAVIQSGIIWDSPEFGATLWHKGDMVLTSAPEPYRLLSLMNWRCTHVSPAMLIIEPPLSFEYSRGRVDLPALVPGRLVAAQLPPDFASLSYQEKDSCLWDLERANLHLYYFFKSTQDQPVRVKIYEMQHRRTVKNILAGSAACWIKHLPVLRGMLAQARLQWDDMFDGHVRNPLLGVLSQNEAIKWMEEAQAYWDFDAARDTMMDMLQCSPDGRVAPEHYEDAMVLRAQLEEAWDEKTFGAPFPFAEGRLSSTLL